MRIEGSPKGTALSLSDRCGRPGGSLQALATDEDHLSEIALVTLTYSSASDAKQKP
jgi:hypothetical protein